MSRHGRAVRLVTGIGFSSAPAWMAAALLFTIVGALSTSFYPYGFKDFVDGFLGGHRDEIYIGAGLIVILYSAGWAAGILGSNAAFGVTDRARLAISERIAQLAASAPQVEHFERADYLQELDLLSENRGMIASAPRQLLSMLQVLVRAGTISLLLGTVYPPLAALTLIGVAPYLGERICVRMKERTQERLSEDKRLINEFFTLSSTPRAAGELRTFGLSDEIIARHRRLARSVAHASARTAGAGAIFACAGWLLFAAAFMAGIGVLLARAAAGLASPGEVLMALALVRRAQLQFAQVADSIGQFVAACATARRLVWLEDYVVATAGTAHGRGNPVPGRLTTGVRLENVSFSYPTGTRALDDVSVTLPVGSVVAVVGVNGAGKSTLVKLLARMYEPTSGVITADGTDIRDFDLTSWRRALTGTFQDFVRYELLAGQTVGVGDLERMAERPALEEAVSAAGAEQMIATLGQGLETPLGRSFPEGCELSVGQWQKLALARGLMRQHPLIMVLDEPAASLDAAAEHILFERYVNTARRLGKTTGTVVLFVSHRFTTVRMADLILVLDEGRLVEMGTHDDLVASAGRYAHLFGLQAAGYR